MKEPTTNQRFQNQVRRILTRANSAEAFASDARAQAREATAKARQLRSEADEWSAIYRLVTGKGYWEDLGE